VTVRVLTYNVRTGGSGGRLDAVVEVVAGQRADVVALQELRDFHRDGGRLLRRVAAALGMRPFLARSLFGQPVAVLVPPAARVRAAGPLRRPFHHAAMRVVVETDRGPLTVVGTHLWPFSGGRRRWEARWLARHADPVGLALLMGDLNSLDPGSDHTERLGGLAPRYRRRHVTRGRVDTRAVATLLRAGFVDLHDRRGGGPDHTAPTSAGGGGEFNRMRLDYVLASPALAAYARDWRVVTGGAAEHASDHYPVVADLALRLA
jgi:endonuclease/exonuclease/phosphatase family metal-dependent hydrolase